MEKYKILGNIEKPSDIKNLNADELKLLCDEIRACLIETVSHNGGHLASNLGTVELTNVLTHQMIQSYLMSAIRLILTSFLPADYPNFPPYDVRAVFPALPDRTKANTIFFTAVTPA